MTSLKLLIINKWQTVCNNEPKSKKDWHTSDLHLPDNWSLSSDTWIFDEWPSWPNPYSVHTECRVRYIHTAVQHVKLITHITNGLDISQQLIGFPNQCFIWLSIICPKFVLHLKLLISCQQVCNAYSINFQSVFMSLLLYSSMDAP